MLADPQSITVGAATIPLPRVGQDKVSADYQSADGTVRLRVTQTTNSTSIRTSISLQTDKVAADPITAVNASKSDTWIITNVRPKTGFTPTELKDQFLGLSAILSATSAAKLLQILGGEK